MKALECLRHFPPLLVCGDFFRRLKAANCGSIRPKLELVRDFMSVLFTCKSEKRSDKNEGARMLTSLYVDFEDTQGQLTPQSIVEFS